MIKSLSPYYLTIPFIAPISGETCTSFTLQVYVWNGLKNVVPANTSYEITIDNVTESISSYEIDIALIINDFIDFTPFDTTTTELIDGFNQYWVKTQILYTTTDEDDYVPNYESTLLMTAGYGYGMDGVNSQIPANKILLTGTEFKVNRNGFFVLPIMIEESEPVETYFATITDYDGDCVVFEFNIPYDEDTIIIQDSIDSGVTWTSKLESSTSPACAYDYPDVPTWFRLKSTGETVYYSNIFVYIP